MRVIIPDDYQDAVRGLACFSKLAGHDVTVFNDTVRDLDALAERFEPADALVLIRERTPIREELLAHLPRLKLISQTGKGTAHIDLAACARRGVTVAVGNAVCTPHLGYVEKDGYESYFGQAFDQVVAFADRRS